MPRSETTALLLKTLLVSDLVDSTRLVEELGDKRAARLYRRHDRLARDLLRQHRGRSANLISIRAAAHPSPKTSASVSAVTRRSPQSRRSSALAFRMRRRT